MYVQEKKTVRCRIFPKKRKICTEQEEFCNVQEKSCMYRKKSVRKEKTLYCTEFFPGREGNSLSVNERRAVKVTRVRSGLHRYIMLWPLLGVVLHLRPVWRVCVPVSALVCAFTWDVFGGREIRQMLGVRYSKLQLYNENFCLPL